jgi:hypothetical protein
MVEVRQRSVGALVYRLGGVQAEFRIRDRIGAGL